MNEVGSFIKLSVHLCEVILPNEYFFLTIILKYPICGIDCGKSVGRMNKVQSVFGVR